MAESKLEEILRGEKPTGSKPSPEQPDLKTTLERELEGEDSELAKELQRTRAEEIIARRRITIDRIRSAQPGQAAQDTGGGKAQERGKEWLTDVAQGLLERGLDPSVVGRTIDYLLGTNAQFPTVGVPGAAAPAQGMTFTDMKEIFKMGQEANKTDPAIAAILERLTDKVTDLESKISRPSGNENPPKRSYVLIKADNTIKEIEADGPVFLEPGAATGEPLEVVKEKNRHEEEMEKVRNDKNYKEGLVNTLADIPESIGRGLANDVRESTPVRQPAPQTGGLETIDCDTCHAKIYYSPDTTKVTCAKCGSVYLRQPKTPNKKEAESNK